jgi:hypothetical protein
MKSRIVFTVIFIVSLFGVSAQNLNNKDTKVAQCIAGWVVQSEVSGMTIISDSIPPLTVGCEELKIINADFRDVDKGWPTGGWCVPDMNEANQCISNYMYSAQRIPQPAEVAFKLGLTLGEYEYIISKIKKQKPVWKDPTIVSPGICISANSGKAQIQNYLHINASDSSLLKSPDFVVKPGKPHLLSLWVRSKLVSNKPNLFFWYDAGLEDINVGYNSIPNTNGEWKRVSLYFRVPADMKQAHFTFSFRGVMNEYVDIADFRLRTASEDEFTAAYKIERAKNPDHIAAKTEEHGKYLATTIAKLERKSGLPDKPFLIWGVGSSWTNSLDDLEPIRQAIRARFPNSPEIIYRKRCGSGTPYDYARGWVETEVMAEQPDLIISYTNGSVQALEQMLMDIRKHSTADIIIPSLHFFQNEQLTDQYINQSVNEEIKKICEKYKAQYVDNRKELASWLKAKNIPITAVLADFVHQNALGKLIINENIAAHFCPNAKPGYSPDSLEKRFYVKDLVRKNASAEFSADGWMKKKDNLIATKKGAKMKFSFTGNRIDLIGVKAQNGGKLKVLIDGLPANKFPAFKVSYVKPAITNITHNGTVQHSSKGNADTGPHGILLGENVSPQKWTIRMTDNEGNYELKGSVTGIDGTGNSKTMFKSTSGQIIIDPEVWRAAKANIKGDNWTFTVLSAATPVVNFSVVESDSSLFSISLAQHLTNDKHTIELISEEDGVVEINSFYVFKPMIK